MLAIFIGFLMALSMIVWARNQPNPQLIYSFSLVSLPLVYFFFSFLHAADNLWLELIWGIPFLLAPVIAFFKPSALTLFVLGLLYLTHGGYDLFHSQLIHGEYVPFWYKMLCVGLDCFVGFYLMLVSLFKIDKKFKLKLS